MIYLLTNSFNKPTSFELKKSSFFTSLDQITVIKKVKKLAKIIFNSFLFWLLLIGLISFVSISSVCLITNFFTFSITIISLVALTILFKKKFDDFIYEVSILDSSIRNFVFKKRWPWFNQISDHIFLGAIPLRNLNHFKTFQEKKISVILSLVEEKELLKKTFLSKAIKITFWKQNNFNYLHLPTKDRMPVSFENLKRAVLFIHQNIKKNKNIYVHCTAGRARSAMCVIAYFIKYQKMTFEEAFNLLKSKRSVVLLNKEQKKALVEFEKKLANFF